MAKPDGQRPPTPGPSWLVTSKKSTAGQQRVPAGLHPYPTLSTQPPLMHGPMERSAEQSSCIHKVLTLILFYQLTFNPVPQQTPLVSVNPVGQSPLTVSDPIVPSGQVTDEQHDAQLFELPTSICL